LLIGYIPFGIYTKDYFGLLLSFIAIIGIVTYVIGIIKNVKTNVATAEEIKPEEKYNEVQPQAAMMIPLVTGVGLLLAFNLMILYAAFYSINTISMDPIIISAIIFFGIAYVFAIISTYEGFKEYRYQKRNNINWKDYTTATRTSEKGPENTQLTRSQLNDK
jgi:magnesium-transporting ATPase (P-type)